MHLFCEQQKNRLAKKMSNKYKKSYLDQNLDKRAFNCLVSDCNWKNPLKFHFLVARKRYRNAKEQLFYILVVTNKVLLSARTSERNFKF